MLLSFIIFSQQARHIFLQLFLSKLIVLIQPYFNSFRHGSSSSLMQFSASFSKLSINYIIHISYVNRNFHAMYHSFRFQCIVSHPTRVELYNFQYLSSLDITSINFSEKCSIPRDLYFNNVSSFT